MLLPATLWAVTGRADNEACDLADLEDRLERMLELIDENYLYPEQLDYKAMIVEGLAAADEGIPDLVVTHDPALGTVRVSTCEQGLDLALGTRPAKQDALLFLTRGLGFAVRTSCYRGRFAMSCADLRDRVLRGLSETLDPHTRYLGQDDRAPIIHPLAISGFGGRTMGIDLGNRPGGTAAILIPSVGCPMGCNFCSTSALFGGKGKFINFYETGDELFAAMCRMEEKLNVKSFFTLDENFLLHKKRALRLLELMEEQEPPSDF